MKRRALFLLLVFIIGSTGVPNSFAAVDGYFPNPNTDPVFKNSLIQTLIQRGRHFAYREGGVSHHYVIRYGQDYEATRRYYYNPIRDQVKKKAGNTENDDFFKILLEKVIYFPLETDSKITLQYETYVKRPKNTETHDVHLAENQVAYLSGSFLDAMSSHPRLEWGHPSQHPEFQGPYFSFTLTEIPKEYLTSPAVLRGFSRVKFLIRQYIREIKSGSQSLQLVHGILNEKLRERSRLIHHFSELYQVRAQERASDGNGVVSQADLTPTQSSQLDRLDQVLARVLKAYRKIYAQEVTSKLVPRNLVPYIQKYLTQADVLSPDDLRELSSEISHGSNDEDLETVPSYFLIFALSQIGQATFDEMKVHETFVLQ